MDQRAAYLLQILETIGSPLMSAIVSAAPASDGPPDGQSDAQTMAALLAKTVEGSIELGNIMDINPAEAQDDTLRVALAGLAGPLIAGQYEKRGQIPESPNIKNITGALQAALTFSDNFAPTPETVERLKNLQASGQVADTYQTQIQYMQAFIPVIEAIAAFPFGQAEAKLIMDVSERLVKRSVELREALLPNIDDEAAQKRIELGFLRALAQLYSACHKGETEKVLGMDAEARTDTLSMEPVWNAFDLRAAMLEALAVKMAPEGQGSSSGGGQAPNIPVTAPPVAVEPPPAAPINTPPVQAESVPPPPPPQEPPPAQAQQQGANPMSMFAKPKAEADETPPAAPAAAPTESPAATPPPQEQPPAEPVQESPPPPPAIPPEQPPAAPPVETNQQNGEQSGSSGSPMSFFKKDEEEE